MRSASDALLSRLINKFFKFLLFIHTFRGTFKTIFNYFCYSQNLWCEVANRSILLTPSSARFWEVGGKGDFVSSANNMTADTTPKIIFICFYSLIHLLLFPPYIRFFFCTSTRQVIKTILRRAYRRPPSVRPPFRVPLQITFHSLMMTHNNDEWLSDWIVHIFKYPHAHVCYCTIYLR